MKAQADVAMLEAIETARRKVAEEKAKTEAELRAQEAAKAQLQQQREREDACAYEEAQKCAAEANAPAMEEAEWKIRRETPPGRFRVDTLHRFFDVDPACRMKIHLDMGDSRSSEGTGLATRPRRKGKGKIPERPRRYAKRHSHDTNPFVTCCDGDGRRRGHRHEPTSWEVVAEEATTPL